MRSAKYDSGKNVCSKAELNSADVESFGNSGQTLLELGKENEGASYLKYRKIWKLRSVV